MSRDPQPTTRFGRFIRRYRVRQILKWLRKAVHDQANAEARITLLRQMLRELGE